MKPTWAMAFARSASQSRARARAGRRAHSWPSGTRPHGRTAAIVFLVGREKNEPGPDFPDVVVTAAKAIADDLHHQTIERLDALAADGKLKEICNAQKDP